MKRKPLIILASIAGIFVLALILLPLLVNADAFRPTVQTQLRNALGRDVQIGALKLALLSGGVEADEITIADDSRFSNGAFLHAKSLKVGVELGPLVFSHALHVTGITLTEPEVTLLHAANGKWNFSSLGSHSAPKAGAGGESKSNLSVATLKIVDGRVLVGQSPSRGKQSTYEAVQLEAHNISYDSPIPFTFDAKTPGGGSLKLEGTAGPINRSDAALSPLDANVTIDHMDLASTGFLDPASGIGGVLDYAGSVRSDGSVAHSEGKATMQQLRLVRSGTPAKPPISFDYASDYNLQKQTGTLTSGAIHAGNSAVQLAGNFDAHGDSTLVHMKVNGSKLPIQDIEGLLPAFGVVLPAGSSLQGGTVDANLNLDGPVDRMVTTGVLSIANAKLAGYNLAQKMAALSAFTGLAPSSETMIQALSSNLRIAPEGIRADNLNLLVANIGSLTGGGTIGANNALNFHMVAHLANGGGGVLSQVAALNPLRQGNNGLPFMVQGTTSNPVFLPDVASALKQNLGAQGQQQDQGLGGILGGLFGKKK